MTNPCRFSLRSIIAVFAFGLSFYCGRAGSISGIVLDSTNQTTLPSASITIAENGRFTVTDSGGRFSFTGVPEGTYNLQVRYIGLDTKIEPVSVPAVGTAQITIRMESDVVVLESMVVEGYREGRSRALQQKQSQTNIADIISSDAIGNVPDRNVAEALARLPGVNLSLEQGEGRYVSIRGVEPNLNQVLIDGAIAAAPGGTRLGRAVPLDTLGTGQISQIEVIKSVTPDLDANSLGGTINIKTASGFDVKQRRITGSVAGNHNVSADKNNYEARLSLADTFGPAKDWGIAVSTSFDRRDYSNHWLQTSWNLRNIAGMDMYLPSGLEIKPEEGYQKRWGGNLSLEYRPDENTQLYIRPNYSETEKFEHTVEVIHGVDNAANRVTLIGPTKALFDGTRTRTERRDFEGLREQKLLSISGGFKKVLHAFTVEGMASISKAKEDRIYDNSIQFRNGTGGTGPITIDWTEFDFTSVSVDPAIDLPSKYPLRRTRADYGIVDEDTKSGKVDLRWDSENIAGHPGFLKTGFKYIHRDRITDLTSVRLEPVGSWNVTAIGVLPSVPVYNGRYDSGFLLDQAATWAYIAANPALTRHQTVDEAANSIEDDYDIDEWIYAGYAMGSVTVNKLTLMGGLRWEKTDATIRAVEARFAGSTFLGHFPTSGSTSYDKVFPNIQGVYRFNDRVLLRAAITQTIGRPAYEDARPLANFRYDPLGSAALDPAFPYSGTLSVGNPDLKPFLADNYDLSLEWYSPGGGTISLAAFKKSITDPIYAFSETQERVTRSGIGLQTLSVSTRLNADSGHINGLEFNVYQPFHFLPSPFNGFGIDANYTHISSGVTVAPRPGADLPFFRQPSELRNVTLFYEMNKFSGRIAYNYADEQLYTLGSATLSDIYRLARKQVDLQARYRINDHYSITASVRNLTREPEQFSYGFMNLMRSSRLLDRDYKVSIDFNY